MGPAWTISVEEALYVALVVLWAMGCYKKPAFIVGCLILTTCVVLRYHTTSSPEVARILRLPPSFFAGNLLYIYRHALAPMMRWSAWPAACLAGAWMFSSAPLLPKWELESLLLLQLVAVIGALGLGLHVRPTFAGWRSQVGELSYGVYVIHGLGVAWFLSHPLPSQALTFSLFIVSAVVAAYLSWHFLEKPALRLGR